MAARIALAERDLAVGAVDRGRRSEHHPANARRAAGLEEAHRPHHVDVHNVTRTVRFWVPALFGYGTARGSSSRGAIKALHQLKRDMAAGRPAGFTVDGPRGPARVAQAGAVWLAKATGTALETISLEEATRLIEGENPVKFWREKRGLSQQSLASTAEISKSLLSEIENGTKAGSVETLRKLSHALKVDLDTLVP